LPEPREVGEAKLIGGILDVLKLFLVLAVRGVYDESLWITEDLLELIVGCIAGGQLSH